MAGRLTKEERKQARRKAKIARVRAARQKKAERDKKAEGITPSQFRRDFLEDTGSTKILDEKL